MIGFAHRVAPVVGLCFLGNLLQPGLRAAEVAASQPDARLESVVQRWKEATEECKRLRLSGTRTVLISIGGEVKRRQSAHWQVKCSGTRLLAQTGPAATHGTSGVGFVFGVNPTYAFALERTHESPWFVTAIVHTPEAVMRCARPVADDAPEEVNSGAESLAAEFEEGLLFAYAPWLISGKLLPDLIAEPGFRVKDFRKETREGTECVALEFDYRPRNPERTVLRGGTVWIAPTRAWSVVGYVADAEWAPQGTRGRVTGSTTYGESPDGAPLPLESTVTYERPLSDGRTAITEERLEFVEYRHETVAPEEFQLSHYELPEAIGGQAMSGDSGRRRGIILLITAGLFLLTAIALYRYGRRREIPESDRNG